MAVEAPRVTVGGGAHGLPPAVVRRVVRRVLAGERRRAAVTVTFLGSVRMRRLNREYLGADRETDVITFALPQPDGSLLGDLYICPPAAARQARAHRVARREELIRLVVHGTLHLLGWDHPEGDERTGSAMWRRQERYVRALR
jgi:probable rRNA maturation factor